MKRNNRMVMRMTVREGRKPQRGSIPQNNMMNGEETKKSVILQTGIIVVAEIYFKSPPFQIQWWF